MNCKNNLFKELMISAIFLSWWNLKKILDHQGTTICIPENASLLKSWIICRGTPLIVAYHANRKVKSFRCSAHYCYMDLVQLTNRKSFRDIEVCLRVPAGKP